MTIFVIKVQAGTIIALQQTKTTLKIKNMFTVSFIAAMMMLFNHGGNSDKPQKDDNVRKNIELTDEQKAISRASNEFTFDFMKILASKEDKNVNMFASPFSLQTALAMTTEGAVGDTREEMLKALKLSDFSQEEIAGFYKTIIPSLEKVDKKTVMEIANSFWSKKAIEIKKDYAAILKADYYAECETLANDKKEAAKAVNAWCSKKTHGMINHVVDEVSEEQMVALINAIYFNGEWSEPFRERSNYDTDFTNHDGTTSKVTLMRRDDDMDVYLGEEARSLSLPYGNRAYVMTIILPEKGVDVDDVVAKLDADTWRKYRYGGRNYEVTLSFPKFETEYTTSDLCIKTLKDMGLKKAFTRSADFTGISKTTLFISQIIHKARVKVNEKGTEAAAVSYIGMELTSAIPRQEHITFKVDRPFIYAISEVSTGAIVFMGVQKKF